VGDGVAVVVGPGGMPLGHYAVDDRTAEAQVIVSLVEIGWATQSEVAAAFGCSSRTVRRYLHRYESGGLAALGRSSGYPKGRSRLKPARERLVTRLKAEGTSNRAIATKLGVDEKAVGKLVRRLGWSASSEGQLSLPGTSAMSLAAADPNLSAHAPEAAIAIDRAPAADPNLSAHAPQTGVELDRAPETDPPAADPNLSAHAPQTGVELDRAPETDPPAADPNVSTHPRAEIELEPIPLSLDSDPADRRFDRLLACLGLLDDAAPMFSSGRSIPRAGVLLALPALHVSGVFDSAREVYGSIGPAFYGLRTTFVALLLMALLRIKRPEALKEHSPPDLGRILGLDRAPEVKTLRRKLTRLAASGRSRDLGRALAAQRAAVRGDALGFLYIDGHVRVYHGQRRIPKAHVTQMRIALPATTDYWINDVNGDPLFVITANANAGLVAMLPVVLGEVRRFVPAPRRITIVFDRGGWSPKLFKTLIADGFDILTYRKGKKPRVPRRFFTDHEADIDGRAIAYTLADQNVRLLRGKLPVRQVTRLSTDGHQTAIVTSRRDLSAIEVAYRMFERWQQENFFKYIGEEYAIDALVDYQVEPDDPTREVPNPVWNALTAELQKARLELEHLQAHYGVEALTNVEQLRRSMRGFKIANADLGDDILRAIKTCVDLEAKRAKVPKRVPIERVAGPDVIKLATERKHLTNLIKMVAYQAESDLVALLAPHYARIDEEGRTLIQTALSSAADIAVTDSELRVTLAPLSSAHRSQAIAKLCQDLNAANAVFPGTKLRLRYAVSDPAQPAPVD